MPQLPCVTLTSPLELGFALGFIAGEGSFTGDKVQPCLVVKVVATDPAPLELLHRIFGGRLNGPYQKPPPRQPTIVWTLRGHDLIAAIPVLRESFLPSRKREQFLEWAEKWRDELAYLATVPPQRRKHLRSQHKTFSVQNDEDASAPSGTVGQGSPDERSGESRASASCGMSELLHKADRLTADDSLFGVWVRRPSERMTKSNAQPELSADEIVAERARLGIPNVGGQALRAWLRYQLQQRTNPDTKKPWTQADIARTAHSSEGSVSVVFRGGRLEGRLGEKIRLVTADALDIPFDVLWKGRIESNA